MHAVNSSRFGALDFPALSIKQPWAQLIMDGKKDVEVRCWSDHYRGPLWIHTGTKIDAYATARFKLDDLSTGVVLGWALLMGIRPFCPDSWKAWSTRHLDDANFNDETCKYGWIVTDVTSLERPVKARGRLKLFHFESDVLKRLERAATKLPLAVRNS